MKFSDLFRQNSRNAPEPYDAERFIPAIRASVCTGEKVAGFREKETGRFREVMLLRDGTDLEAFRRQYGITGPIETFY